MSQPRVFCWNEVCSTRVLSKNYRRHSATWQTTIAPTASIGSNFSRGASRPSGPQLGSISHHHDDTGNKNYRCYWYDLKRKYCKYLALSDPAASHAHTPWPIGTCREDKRNKNIVHPPPRPPVTRILLSLKVSDVTAGNDPSRQSRMHPPTTRYWSRRQKKQKHCTPSTPTASHVRAPEPQVSDVTASNDPSRKSRRHAQPNQLNRPPVTHVPPGRSEMVAKPKKTRTVYTLRPVTRTRPNLRSPMALRATSQAASHARTPHTRLQTTPAHPPCHVHSTPEELQRHSGHLGHSGHSGHSRTFRTFRTLRTLRTLRSLRTHMDIQGHSRTLKGIKDNPGQKN